MAVCTFVGRGEVKTVGEAKTGAHVPVLVSVSAMSRLETVTNSATDERTPTGSTKRG